MHGFKGHFHRFEQLLRCAHVVPRANQFSNDLSLRRHHDAWRVASEGVKVVAETRRKAAMAAIPVGIHPNVVLSELVAIGASATTRHDRIARTEARIDRLRADLAYAADRLGWEKQQKERHLAEILKTLTEARQLASTEQFAVLDRAIELLRTKGSKPPAQEGAARLRLAHSDREYNRPSPWPLMEGAMPKLPNWLTLVLRWGGLALAVLMAAILIVVKVLTKAPEAGAMPAPSAAPEWLYWVLLVVGVVAAAVGFSLRQRKA